MCFSPTQITDSHTFFFVTRIYLTSSPNEILYQTSQTKDDDQRYDVFGVAGMVSLHGEKVHESFSITVIIFKLQTVICFNSIYIFTVVLNTQSVAPKFS